MSSSKFSSPFLNKSPLRGAYYSGADGMVTVSYDDVHQKFQDGLAQNVAKARKIHNKKNVDNCEGLDDKLLDRKMSSSVHTRAKQICADREKQDYLKSPEGKKATLDQKVRDRFKKFQEEHGTSTEMLQGYRGEFDFFKSRQVEKERKRKKEQDTISNAGKLIFK